MFLFLYNIFLLLFRAGSFLYAFINEKAKKWVIGRKNIFEKLKNAISKNDNVIWMHCASLGEFEQGRPVFEKLKTQYPNYKFLITFFSPSGYEVQKNYIGADWVFYLPLDGEANARRFLEIVHPSLVIFVKYEFWYYYLKNINSRNIPIILISAVFRKEMSSLKWFAGFQLKMLSLFDHLFLQNKNSAFLLDEFNRVKNYSVAGDTRFDRVLQIAENFQPIETIEKFGDGKKLFVAGSTWSEDEAVISKAAETFQKNDMKLIIAPHEINENHLTEIQTKFPNSILFSKLEMLNPQSITQDTLIIDNYGMLSTLYSYAFISFVGGGFAATGVHNVTEAAVYGKPVITGPKISKYPEAVELVNIKGGYSVSDASELINLVEEFITNKNDCYNQASKAAYNYIRENAGATDKILHYIQEKRLLTRL